MHVVYYSTLGCCSVVAQSRHHHRRILSIAAPPSCVVSISKCICWLCSSSAGCWCVGQDHVVRTSSPLRTSRPCLRQSQGCETFHSINLLWSFSFTIARTTGGSRVSEPCIAASPASLSALSFPNTAACPGQKIQVILSSWLYLMAAIQSEYRLPFSTFDWVIFKYENL